MIYDNIKEISENKALDLGVRMDTVRYAKQYEDWQNQIAYPQQELIEDIVDLNEEVNYSVIQLPKILASYPK